MFLVSETNDEAEVDKSDRGTYTPAEHCVREACSHGAFVDSITASHVRQVVAERQVGNENELHDELTQVLAHVLLASLHLLHLLHAASVDKGCAHATQGRVLLLIVKLCGLSVQIQSVVSVHQRLLIITVHNSVKLL